MTTKKLKKVVVESSDVKYSESENKYDDSSDKDDIDDKQSIVIHESHLKRFLFEDLIFKC